MNCSVKEDVPDLVLGVCGDVVGLGIWADLQTMALGEQQSLGSKA